MTATVAVIGCFVAILLTARTQHRLGPRHGFFSGPGTKPRTVHADTVAQGTACLPACEQRTAARRLRMLHTIATQTNRTEHQRIEGALRFALEELELEQAYLGIVDERSHELVMRHVVARDGAPTYGTEQRYSLPRTLIGHVVASSEVFSAPDVIEARAAFGITHTDEWKSFIACAIRSGSQRGVIGFKGRAVRQAPFLPDDTEFVRDVADLVAASVQRDQHHQHLTALAFYDSLTGLPNRVLLTDRLQQCIVASRRGDAPFALLFLDLDGFKTVNDSLGHAAGDNLLKTIAARLTTAAREGDTVARLGGDEFVVLAPSIETGADALDFASRIAGSAACSLTGEETAIGVTASIGISLFPEHGSDAETLLRHADAAMFSAKLRGRGHIQLAARKPGVVG